MDYIIKKRHKQIKKTATTLTNNNKKMIVETNVSTII